MVELPCFGTYMYSVLKAVADLSILLPSLCQDALDCRQKPSLVIGKSTDTKELSFKIHDTRPCTLALCLCIFSCSSRDHKRGYFFLWSVNCWLRPPLSLIFNRHAFPASRTAVRVLQSRKAFQRQVSWVDKESDSSEKGFSVQKFSFSESGRKIGECKIRDRTSGWAQIWNRQVSLVSCKLDELSTCSHFVLLLKSCLLQLCLPLLWNSYSICNILHHFLPSSDIDKTLETRICTWHDNEA